MPSAELDSRFSNLSHPVHTNRSFGAGGVLEIGADFCFSTPNNKPGIFYDPEHELEEDYDFSSIKQPLTDRQNVFGLVSCDAPYYAQVTDLSPPSSVSHSLTPASVHSPSSPQNDENSEGLSCSGGDDYDPSFQEGMLGETEECTKEQAGTKKKRRRTSPDQLRILISTFVRCPMPSYQMRVDLANKLGMTPRSVQVWFQNRRAKEKTDMKKSEKCHPPQGSHTLPNFPLNTSTGILPPFAADEYGFPLSIGPIPSMPCWNPASMQKALMFAPQYNTNNDLNEDCLASMTLASMGLQMPGQLVDSSQIMPGGNFSVNPMASQLETNMISLSNKYSPYWEDSIRENYGSSYVQLADISPPNIPISSRSFSLPF